MILAPGAPAGACIRVRTCKVHLALCPDLCPGQTKLLRPGTSAQLQQGLIWHLLLGVGLLACEFVLLSWLQRQLCTSCCAPGPATSIGMA